MHRLGPPGVVAGSRKEPRRNTVGEVERKTRTAERSIRGSCGYYNRFLQEWNEKVSETTSSRRAKSISPNLPDINPRPSGRLTVSGLTSFRPGDCGNYPPPGVCLFCACPWLVSFVRVRPAIVPGGPNPPGASAADRPGRRARRGRCRLRSRAWCWSRFRSARGPGGRKKRRRFLSAVCRLSTFDPVVDVSVLDHRVGPVACDDDMIEDEDADPVQQLLKLNR